MTDDSTLGPAAKPHRRRPRYAGKYPRRFDEKYKEHDPSRHRDVIERIVASGKTPAGTHRPVMVEELLAVTAPTSGNVVVDCTLGYGGHALEFLARIRPGGLLLGLDVDPIELGKTEARLRSAGFGPDVFRAHRSNFAGLPRVLGAGGLSGADIIIADLGVSSMQLDDPTRGFSVKLEGLLDMRMNPERGQTASALLRKLKPEALELLLTENADEPNAAALALALAGKSYATTTELVRAVRATLPGRKREDVDLVIRRVFQALRIAVNDEFSAIETFLRHLPSCLNPNGRVAILTFHSGEDRRVKKGFEAARRDGLFSEISDEVMRPSREEVRSNPRSSSAKLRWARRSG